MNPQKNFYKVRESLIQEIIEEFMSEEVENGSDENNAKELAYQRAKKYFSIESNREAINKIAQARTAIQPIRDLSISRFVKEKWKKKRESEQEVFSL